MSCRLHLLLGVFHKLMTTFSVISTPFDNKAAPFANQLVSLSFYIGLNSGRLLIEIDNLANPAFSQMVTSNRQLYIMPAVRTATFFLCVVGVIIPCPMRQAFHFGYRDSARTDQAKVQAIAVPRPAAGCLEYCRVLACWQNYAKSVCVQPQAGNTYLFITVVTSGNIFNFASAGLLSLFAMVSSSAAAFIRSLRLSSSSSKLLSKSSSSTFLRFRLPDNNLATFLSNSSNAA